MKIALLHCSNPLCSALCYLEETVPGRLIPGEEYGRYCEPCAIAMGYWSQGMIDTLERLLDEAGLFGRPEEKPRREVRPKHFDGRLNLFEPVE